MARGDKQLPEILYLNRVCVGTTPRAGPVTCPAVAAASVDAPSWPAAPGERRRDSGQVPPAAPPPPSAPGPTSSFPGSACHGRRLCGLGQPGTQQPAREGAELCSERLDPIQPWIGRWPENSGTRSEPLAAPLAAPRSPGAEWVGGGYPRTTAPLPAGPGALGALGCRQESLVK